MLILLSLQMTQSDWMLFLEMKTYLIIPTIIFPVVALFYVCKRKWEKVGMWSLGSVLAWLGWWSQMTMVVFTFIGK